MMRSVVLTSVVLTLWVHAALAEVQVFAAASTTQAVEEVGQAFAKKGLGSVKASFASSSTLAKQIEQGAPANLFVSADTEWADYLEKRNLLVEGSRSNLFGNTLVLIAPADAKTGPLAINEKLDIDGLLGTGRLAVGDPDHVPVGIYAHQAFANLGLWNKVEPKLARADSVRAALAMVERGETPLGVVYGSDAVVSGKVKVLGTFDPALMPPIVYPMALVKDHDTPEARKLLDFMKTPEAKAIFVKYGFRAE
jgi:molybdate transport system substrate-binding protein